MDRNRDLLLKYRSSNQGGFDIVIGNPPYVDYRKISEETKNGLNYYTSYKINKTGSLYVYFIERGITLLKQSGILSFINPYQYLNADSGLGLRTFIFENHRLSKLIDVSNLKVFKASTYTCINFFIANQQQSDICVFSPSDCSTLELNYKVVECNSVSKEDGYKVFLSNNTIIDKVASQGQPLERYADVFCGLSATGFRNYVSPTKKNDNYLLFTESKQIDYYVTTTEKYIEKSVYSKAPLTAFKNQCIFMARMTSHMRAAISRENETAGKVNVIHNFRNVNPLYLLGLLNSKLLDYYYRIKNEAKHLNGGAFGFDTPSIKELPIKIDKQIEDKIVSLVSKIIAIKQSNSASNTIDLEKQIDNLVNALYELTEEETKQLTV